MQTESPTIYRMRWLPLLGIVTGILFLGALLIQKMGAAPTGVPAAPPTVTTLNTVKIESLGITLLAPQNWHAPALKDDHSFVLSPDGSSDTTSTAGPFLYGVVDALEVFSRQLTLRTDLDDPVAQLDALIKVINRDRARFTAAKPYTRAQYPAAFVEGIERGNELLIVLIKGEGGRWIYLGAQAREDQFPYYDVTVFKPAINALSLIK
ncbi:MAG: hypothetical protein IAE83_08570 [Anaerolinea sp.]|nr:hypothetical protein [Anaerolinea sp.]MCC6976609.1 hypothetical protein [Anaerolineae bacterium]